MAKATFYQTRQNRLNEYAEEQESKISRKAQREYLAEFKRLQKEIASFYQEYGINNIIEYRRLMEQLSPEDAELLIKQEQAFFSKYPEYANLLKVRDNIYKLNRLEGLQYSVVLNMAERAGWTNDLVTPYLNELAKRSANYAMETLGFGKNFYTVNSDIVKKFVDNPWIDEKNYTTRIWENLQKQALKINNHIAMGVARGDSYDRIVKWLEHICVDVPRRDLQQLVMTEATYVMNQTSKEVFEKDFDTYTYRAILDKKTCSVCRALNGKVFNFSDAQAGVNFPPMHTRCRCSVMPWVEDWDEWIDNYVESHGGDGAEAKALERRLKEVA